ncbi:extracellular solute-binding protein [Paenibacillus sp. MCAF9]|uniref:extracellular solute-binding protein n=1 Tax=Paenibacillus sp. MCAF9 TaxID=3233046 RepID=UPI003F966984
MKYTMMINVALLFITLLSSCVSTTTIEEAARNSEEPKSKDTLTIQLVSINGSFYGVEHHRLARKIKRFGDLNPNTNIMIRWINDYNFTQGSNSVPTWIKTTKPADLYTVTQRVQDVPDIFELAPNQMLELYRRGAIEPLNMNETGVSEYVISSNDGYVLGIKSKINPMIVYYNKQAFESLGLDPPSNQWDWEKLNDTIVKLRAAGENVYIPFNPYSLEWATSLNGRRIAAVDGVTYRGYLDSEVLIG